MKLKKPNWQEASNWPFISVADGEFEIGTTEVKSRKWPEQDSKLRPLDCEFEVQATWPL